jgi:hypothetical protein
MAREEDKEEENNRAMEGLKPEVYLRMKVTLKEAGIGGVTDAEREASKTIAQELREVMPEEKEGEDAEGGGGGVVVGAMGTVRSAMQTAKWIQNLIASIVDAIESAFNIVSWVDMHKSMLVFVALGAVFVLLICIPTRWVVLIGVLQQFGMGLYVKMTREARRKRRKLEKKRKRGRPEEEKEEWGNPVLNLISSVPTGEDLRRNYFWESFRRGQVEKNVMEKKRREARLREIWKAKFARCVKLRMEGEGGWKSVFLVLQSHRIIWFKDEKDFDDGELSIGMLLFVGHSGLSGLSPLELKVMSREEGMHCVTVFGRGEEGSEGKTDQMKRTFLCKDMEEKQLLEDMLLEIIRTGD